MKIWFPDLYTEAHRSDARKQDLVDAFRAVGVTCYSRYSPICDLVFCGSIFTSKVVRETDVKGKPVVHYNWDLYPWVIENRKKYGWPEYIEDIRTAASVIVPSIPTRVRTVQYTDRDAVVILAPVKVWPCPTKSPKRLPNEPKGYVLDVMRDYAWDAGNNLILKAAKEARIPVVQSKTSRPWDVYTYLAGNAAAVVSTCEEASTGGLSLLEAYAHGVHVILTDAPMNGGQEYFKERGNYFNHKDPADLVKVLKSVWDRRDEPSAPDALEWVQENYSDLVFARNLKTEFERCLSTRSPATRMSSNPSDGSGRHGGMLSGGGGRAGT